MREDRAHFEQKHSLTPSDDYANQPGCSLSMIEEKPERWEFTSCSIGCSLLVIYWMVDTVLRTTAKYTMLQ